jgi:hypothetical protein
MITVAADPYFSDTKAYKAFDERKLNSKGYFPVHVIIHNSTSNEISLRTLAIVLIGDGEKQFYTTPAAVLVEDVFDTNWQKKQPETRYREGPGRIKIGSPLVDFTTKELTNQSIAPGSVASGFLYFFLGKVEADLLQSFSLSIPEFIEERSQEKLGPFSIPLNAAFQNEKSASIEF